MNCRLPMMSLRSSMKLKLQRSTLRRVGVGTLLIKNTNHTNTSADTTLLWQHNILTGKICYTSWNQLNGIIFILLTTDHSFIVSHMCVYVCVLLHFWTHCPVCGVIRDPGVTREAALHNGVVVLVLLAVFHKTAHTHTHTCREKAHHTQKHTPFSIGLVLQIRGVNVH